jgi:type III restriction enzyme
VKNHGLYFEVPYNCGSESRQYRPDFIVVIEDGLHKDPIHLVVEVKGYRRQDADDKKRTMETFWVPGVNNDGRYGRWAFAELTDVFQMESDFASKVEEEFNKIVTEAIRQSPQGQTADV